MKVKEKTFADKKIILIITIGILGMLLMLIPNNSEKNKEIIDDEAELNMFSEYEKDLTDKITEILSAISDVSDVRVLLTLDCYEEYVYANDEEYKENKSNENSNIEKKKSYIIIDDDKHKAKGGMFIKVITPRVRGVGVVCKGAESAVVRHEITKILCSALGISTSNVHITS